MGRELVLKKIKKDGGKMLTGGCLLFAFGFLLTFFFVIAFEGLDPMLIISALPLIIGAVMLGIGVRMKTNPMSAGCFKTNPQLMEQADELFAHTIYEDDFIVFSDKVIANKKKITQMTYLQDILWIYEYKETYNFIPNAHNVIIETRGGYSIEISVYGKSKKTREELFDRICQFCPHAMVGYSPENAADYNQLKQSHANSRQ